MGDPKAVLRNAPSAAQEADTSRADLMIRRTTFATVFFLAALAAIISYGHMHTLALRHGEGRGVPPCCRCP